MDLVTLADVRTLLGHLPKQAGSDRPIPPQFDSAVSRHFPRMKLSMSCWFRSTATRSVVNSIRLESSSRVPSSFTARTASDVTVSDILLSPYATTTSNPRQKLHT